ncbi:hypothetical protein CC1G_03159 [Coprinopsis cinerea okayama7|uniref:Uncharacterized protein n=1 Tax=Coprinopsis cinerea (strain Okayama-7 / 130 / ATCC MYA-4618 / FGSC 9003) TaxID=240176 RepID=A8PF53_COPC7|nr:hypothetical protein CC1G_03159 [Coprinopsis cinerea okayama7\|eukprot:XP_001840930.2 hypothetical protein CC1G_03159 [Coprinopsis cinerea okayama7\
MNVTGSQQFEAHGQLQQNSHLGVGSKIIEKGGADTNEGGSITGNETLTFRVLVGHEGLFQTSLSTSEFNVFSSLETLKEAMGTTSIQGGPREDWREASFRLGSPLSQRGAGKFNGSAVMLCTVHTVFAINVAFWFRETTVFDSTFVRRELMASNSPKTSLIKSWYRSLAKHHSSEPYHGR